MTATWEITTVEGKTTLYSEPSWSMRAGDSGITLTFKGEAQVYVPWERVKDLQIREQGVPTRSMSGVL